MCPGQRNGTNPGPRVNNVQNVSKPEQLENINNLSWNDSNNNDNENFNYKELLNEQE